MITGTVKITEDGLELELLKDGDPIKNKFEQIMFLRDIVNNAVDSWEKNIQIGYIAEVKNAVTYEELSKAIDDIKDDPKFEGMEQLQCKRSSLLSKERYFMGIDPAVEGQVNIFYLDDDGQLKQIKK